MSDINYIKNVRINRFRLFNNLSFTCGKHITAIAGRNATGKSTILGMIAHSSELKVKEGRPINHPQFRSEFSELFNASKQFDTHKKGTVEYEINMCNNIGEEIDSSSFRITWQDEGERFRLIPKRIINNKVTASKFNHASLFLGLSRLYPIAETSTSPNDFKKSEVTLSLKEKQEFNILYRNIMGPSTNLNTIDKVESQKTKITNIGISTDNYDAFANSAGQNNIGQILLALLSFKRQKEKDTSTYTGGLLCIDELDATLHPAAQQKLYGVLKQYAEKYSIQIVFTTHSLYLLDIIREDTHYNSERSELNKIELIYVTSANGDLEIIESPNKRVIYNEITEGAGNYSFFKVNIFTEDAEARWFVTKLLNLINVHSSLRIAQIKMGHDEYKALHKHDPAFFRDSIIILDGDSSIPCKNSPFMKLPGETNPELLFFDFLNNLETLAWREISATTEYSFSKNVFEDNSWKSFRGKEPRDKQKEWFNCHINYFEQFSLFDLWKDQNDTEVQAFINEFKIKFNKIAKKNRIPMI